MLSKCNRLKEVLVEGILILDTYIASVSEFINILEENSNVADCKREVHILKSQNQSLLLTLSIMRDIKSKKINSLKSKVANCNREAFILKSQNRSLLLTLIIKDIKNEKVNSLRIYLKDHNYRAILSKPVKVKIHLKVHNDRGN